MVYNSDSGGDGGDVPTNICDKLRAPICAQATCGRVCVSAVSDEDPKPDEDPKLDEAPHLLRMSSVRPSLALVV